LNSLHTNTAVRQLLIGALWAEVGLQTAWMPKETRSR
jgi:hypothetical protein